jgi:hypothetical protein
MSYLRYSNSSKTENRMVLVSGWARENEELGRVGVKSFYLGRLETFW